MRVCCIPGCRQQPGNHKTRTSLHRVPYYNKPLWKHWSKLCPFLLKYNFLQLENLRICKKHFIPEHYDYEKKRLKWCSLPLLNVPGIKIVKKDDNEYTFLEINPMTDSKSLNFNVVTPCSLLQTKSPDRDLPKADNVKQPHRYLVTLKADSHGLPVDHSMYCSPPESSHDSSVTAEPSNIKCMAETRLIDREPIEVQFGAASNIPNRGLNTDTETHDCTERSEQGTEPVAPSGEGSVTDNLDTESCEDYSSTPYLYNILTDITDNQKSNNLVQENQKFQAQVLEKADNMKNLLTCESINMNCSLEIPAIPTKEKFIQPNTQVGASVLSEHSKLKTYENSFKQVNNQLKFYNQPPAMITNKAVQLTWCNSQTVKSAAAGLNQTSSAGMPDQHLSLPVGAPSEPALLSTSTPKYYQSMQKPLTQKSVTSQSKICKGKENSKSDENKIKALRERCRFLRKKLTHFSNKCKTLQLRLDGMQAKTKLFLKAYPRLTSRTKELIETQLRLAGKKPKAARYNEEEKLFAKRLYQISPDCYRFMQQYLKLPGRTMVLQKWN